MAVESGIWHDPRPGYRRRILIEPSPGSIRTELEDDYHRMVVTLVHADGVITNVESSMKRSPWNTCPGAIAQLSQTFRGKRLDDVSVRDEKAENCTHLFDLATFGAGHAGEVAPIAYEVEVSDPIAHADGEVIGRIWRDGRLLYELTHREHVFLAPADLAGVKLWEMGGWIAAQPRETREAAKILRWAMMIAGGRMLDLKAGAPASRFARAACFNFQPDMAEIARRRPGADVDFTAIGVKPMADREAMFPSRG